MQVLTKKFKHATGYTIKTSIGSTGTLYAQITHGAPYDLFLAADAERPKKLERAGRTVPATRFTYAVGKLVLWGPKRDRVTQKTLTSGAFNRLAIANPRTAPYGAAARQALISLHLWHGLQSKIVRGESINQAYQFVVSGNAALGLIARSQLAKPPGDSAWVLPQTLYPPLTQQAVLLKHGRHNPAARAFLRFLHKKVARGVIARFGYRVPRQ